MINTLLQAIAQAPGDQLAWMALADCLEEQGDPLRAELVRFTRLPCQHEIARQWVQQALLDGHRPCVPTFTSSVGMKLALVPAGKFLMGSPEDEAGRSGDEGPQRKVEITRPFWMGAYPVTQEEYEAVMGINPCYLKGGRLPVDNITWDDAVEFCWRLSIRDSKPYRLPTEAEWEFACRAGSTTPFYTGSNEKSLRKAGWYISNGGGRAHPVGEKVPNAWGLFDMHGNVWEWCADWYGDYPATSQRDPPGPAHGSFRVFRGGSWVDDAWDCRSADRSWVGPAYRNNYLGLRVVCNHEVQG